MSQFESAALLLRFSSLGDVVLCSAAAKKLCVERRNELLYFVSNPNLKSFIKKSFPAQNLKFIGGKKLFGSYFFHGWETAQKIIKKHEDLKSITLYDLHGVSKSRIWALGFQLRSFFSWQIKTHKKSTKKKSIARSLSLFGFKKILKKRFIYLEHLQTIGGDLNYKPHLLAQKKISKDSFKILIAPDSQRWKKKWIIQHWEDYLNDLLKNSKIHISIVGGIDSIPKDLTESLQQRFPEQVENLLGKTSLTELPQIAASHQLCICGNSAWLHISEAVGTPVISLAGPIIPEFGFSPWMTKSTELSVDLKCRPCSKHGGGLCKLKEDEFHACMKKVTPAELLLNTKKYFPKEFNL